jgi:cytochrome b
MNHATTVKVWDISIRIFHWSLVLAFFIAYLSGDELELVHAYAGYYILGLLLYRIVWGLLGTRYARFSSFLFTPTQITAYLKSALENKAVRYLGHNPAGSVMVFMLLISLAMTTWSGLELYAIEGKGPLAGNAIEFVSDVHADDHELNEGSEEFWEELHELMSNFTMVLVGLHILGVLFSARLHKENLIQAMITGRKRAP